MNKKGRFLVVLIIFLSILMIAAIFAGGYYYYTKNIDKPVKTTSTTSNTGGGTYNGTTARSSNPVEGKTIEEAVAEFDEDFILYLLKSIGISNLHNPPFSKDEPKIEIHVDDEIYNARVSDGKIIIGKGEIEEEDIQIYTSKVEAVKMIKDKNYIKESFATKFSWIELVASKIELGSKGYLDIYNQFS